MPISSFVLTCDRADLACLRATLAAMPEVDVGHTVNGRLPVVIDTRSRRDDKRVMRTLEDLPSVTHLQLIFADFTDNQESM